MSEDKPTPAPTPSPGRDANGRFAVGNPGGPGGSRRRACELRQAAIEAVTCEHIQALMRRALRQGLEGNLPAAKFVIEQTAGKAMEMTGDAHPSDFTLPKLNSVANCTAALDLLAAAVSNRTVDLATAKVMHDIVQSRLKAIEVGDLEQRLIELEKTAATVDLGTGRR